MSEILIGLAGDVLVNRKDPYEVFRDVKNVLTQPSILFANLEGVYTDEPRRVPGEAGGVYGPANNLEIFADVGFNVMSLANNHILDMGYDAMLENRSRLRVRGVQTCGAGESIDDAHEPAMVESDGVRVAFLAYASVFPLGWEARSDSPGLAPVRAYDFWRSVNPRYHLPGTPPVASTVPDERDLARVRADIERAHECADLVVTSFHWGDAMRPFLLTDHEKRTARYCIDHGADMVIGHHHHALRGMEWYRNKPILYGLGHFVFDFPLRMSDEQFEKLLKEMDPTGLSSSAPYTIAPRKGWPYLPMHEDTRMTMLAWATADRSGVRDIGFLPCQLVADGSVQPLGLSSPEADAVWRYMDKCHSTQGLNGRVVTERSIVLAGYETLRVVPK
jgi:poly-gamma-glutamate capsule biosynthesis protein CapA/YwtB (metallophosphatase superfamily)